MTNSCAIPFDPESLKAIPMKEGPPGQRGLPGAAAQSFHFQQSQAATTWTVNHNLGYQPSAVTIRSPGGRVVEADVLHTSLNQLIVTFAGPYAGSVDVI